MYSIASLLPSNGANRLQVIKGTFQPNLKSGQEVSQELVDELLTEYSTSSGYRLYPDVKPLFQQLISKDGWKWDRTIVGIITNSDDRVPSILESFGLKVGPRRAGLQHESNNTLSGSHDIDFVVLSYDVGYEKPDRRIFDAASAMLKDIVASSGDEADFEKIHVGDEAEKDYFGAKKAGWHAIHLTRQEPRSDSGDIAIKHTSISTIDERGSKVNVKVPTITDLRALKFWTPDV
jgi:FMN phosphatase YigB (HAD superfamily)